MITEETDTARGVGSVHANRTGFDDRATRPSAALNLSRMPAVAVMAADGHVTGWNPAAERLLGWRADEIRCHGLDRIFTPEDRAARRHETTLREALARGRVDAIRWHAHRDGSRVRIASETTPLRDRDDRHVGFVTVLSERSDESSPAPLLHQMHQAERRLMRAQEAGKIGLFSIGVEDGILRGTPEFCRLFGMPERDAHPAETFERLVIADDAGLISTTTSRREGTTARDVEFRIRRADTGEIRWIARTGEVERDRDGRPVEFFGVARDITDQRHSSDALRESEERYRALFKAIDDGFCIIEFVDGPHGPSSDYVHVEANPGYGRQTGITDIIGKRLREIAPDEAEGWLEIYGTVLRTGEPVRFERDFRAAGRFIEVSAARVGPASRRQVSVLFRDISARKRAEEALRRSEAVARENVERVQLALGAGAIIGTWHWDVPNDRFTVDEAFARSFGLDAALGREGLRLAQIAATIHPDDRAGFLEAIDGAITRGGSYAHQYRTLRADGRYYWVEANGRVGLASDGTPLTFPGVLIDAEKRRAVEAERERVNAMLRSLNDTLELRVAERTSELMQAEEALRQAQKMEAVGQLTGGLAHDFNNMLAGIVGSLELMQSRMLQGRFSDLDRYITAAQGAAKRAAALTHRLLAFSRRQTLDPKPTDVNRLVADMVELVRRSVGPSVRVDAVGTAGLWPTLVDPSQLENALLNLCINARDAMPDGGRIVIETGNLWLDDQTAKERGLDPGHYVTLGVSDDGTGMPPDVAAKAFDPFFTTKPIGEGTGLGLSMIYGFAKQSGGQIQISTELGAGTTVSLYLPRHHGSAEDADAPAEVPEAARARAGETVLVVDDEPTVRMLVTEVLEDLGYAAIEAADSASGLTVLQSDVRIDLLVTDVGLPGGMNGRQMADAALVTRPNLKVLFITGYAENAALNHGHLAHGMQVMTKPFSLEALATRIRGIIEGEG